MKPYRIISAIRNGDDSSVTFRAREFAHLDANIAPEVCFTLPIDHKAVAGLLWMREDGITTGIAPAWLAADIGEPELNDIETAKAQLQLV